MLLTNWVNSEWPTMLEVELAMQGKGWHDGVAGLSCKATLVAGPNIVKVVGGMWVFGRHFLMNHKEGADIAKETPALNSFTWCLM
jgi:hypothetical protein